MQSTHYSYKILIKLQFSWQLKKKTEISNLMKICPVGTKLSHVDGQAHR
jgi:hypothetical protein